MTDISELIVKSSIVTSSDKNKKCCGLKRESNRTAQQPPNHAFYTGKLFDVDVYDYSHNHEFDGDDNDDFFDDLEFSDEVEDFGW